MESPLENPKICHLRKCKLPNATGCLIVMVGKLCSYVILIKLHRKSILSGITCEFY